MFKGVLDNVRTNAIDFQIKLDCGNTNTGTSDLEIHVAIMIFITHDIGKERVLVFFLNEADGNTSNRVGDRNTSIHKCQSAAANRSHAGRSIGFHDVGNQPNGVGESFDSRKHSLKAAFCKGTVANFSSTGAAVRFAFANTERREVVIEHELFGDFISDAINALFIA